MKMRRLLNWAFIAFFWLTACQPEQEKATYPFPFLNPDLPIETRVSDLLGRLTPQQKIDQLLYEAPAIDSLYIPAYNWWNECLHGVGRAGIATVFPQAIGMAATWDTLLMHQIAITTSDEARIKHRQFLGEKQRGIYQGLTFWTPNINIFRDPRWGRGQETYGEDPYLTSRLAVAFIKGLQGDHPDYLKLVATAKHFAVHSGPEATRHSFDAVPTRKDLEETYLPAFIAAVQEANAASVMCAYNRLDGLPCCGSDPLLEQLLRKQMGFTGYVVSDCWAIVDFFEEGRHGTSPDAPSAAALALKSGTDLNCGSTYPFLKEALAQGLITEADLDKALGRLLVARFRLGMFDPPARLPWNAMPDDKLASAKHTQLALQAARASMVLLKNNGLLPMQLADKKVAVIGPNASDYQVMLGNYHGTPREQDTPLKAFQREKGAVVEFAEGCELAAGVPLLVPIPSSALRTADGKPGLKASYYNTLQPTGTPVREVIDPSIDFWWAGKGPIRGSLVDTFSVIWEGVIVPPATGTYTLGIDAGNIGELYLADTLVVKFDNVHHPLRKTLATNLRAGQEVKVKVVMGNYGADPQAHLLWSYNDPAKAEKALALARQSDVTFFFAGLAPHIEGEEMPVKIEGFDGGDRTLIELPRSQRELLEKLLATGKPVVIVLMSGSAVALPPAAVEKAAAILQAWYPGQEGGTALLDILTGRANPSGKLPVTCYQRTADLPEFDDYRMAGRTYRYFDKPTQFPFGFGLSYTKFAYSGLQVTGGQKAGESVQVTVTVANTGDIAGEETVQVYVSTPNAGKTAPKHSLVKFGKVSLKSGESKEMKFTLSPNDLKEVSENGERVRVPGNYTIYVGGCQPVAPVPASTMYEKASFVMGAPVQ
jgi:beta-glucosidase